MAANPYSGTEPIPLVWPPHPRFLALVAQWAVEAQTGKGSETQQVRWLFRALRTALTSSIPAATSSPSIPFWNPSQKSNDALAMLKARLEVIHDLLLRFPTLEHLTQQIANLPIAETNTRIALRRLLTLGKASPKFQKAFSILLDQVGSTGQSNLLLLHTWSKSSEFALAYQNVQQELVFLTKESATFKEHGAAQPPVHNILDVYAYLMQPKLRKQVIRIYKIVQTRKAEGARPGPVFPSVQDLRAARGIRRLEALDQQLQEEFAPAFNATAVHSPKVHQTLHVSAQVPPPGLTKLRPEASPNPHALYGQVSCRRSKRLHWSCEAKLRWNWPERVPPPLRTLEDNVGRLWTVLDIVPIQLGVGTPLSSWQLQVVRRENSKHPWVKHRRLFITYQRGKGILCVSQNAKRAGQLYRNALRAFRKDAGA